MLKFTSPPKARLVRAFSFLAALFFTFSADAALLDIVTKGSTDRSVYLDIIDSTDGTPETGVVYNTSGIDLWYRREGAAVVSITEATLAALTTAHTDGGFLHVGNGTYRLDLPDAAFATGANQVQIGGTVTGMVVIGGTVRLVDYSLEDSVRMGLTALPNAAAAASGGLLISGSNSGTTTLGALTVTGATTLTGNVSMAAGLNITQSSSNTAALVITGNGTGNGATITSGSGATGTGLAVVSAATNGSAATFAGVGTGNGITATGGATGHGVSGVGGSTSGNGIRATGTAGNSAALNLIGQGSAAGLLSTGGATGHGIAAVGGATSGSGLSAIASTSGNGIVATGVGTTQAGIAATGGTTSSAGISATGGGTGSGILATSGGGATGNGITATAASTNGNGVSWTGTGTGAGVLATAGATGAGMSLVGGSTSGHALATTVTQPLGAVPGTGIQEAGTLQSATGTTAVLRAATSIPDDNPIGMTIEIVAGTGAGQSRTITDWVSSTDTATVATWTTTPDNTSDYYVWGTSAASGSGSAPTAAEIADAVLDEDMTAHQTQGTLGQVIGDSVSDSDSIWALANTNLNATVGSRASQTSVDTVDDYVDTEIGTLTTRLGAPSDLGGGASIAANLADIEAQTDDIGAAGAGLTAADDSVMTRLGAPVGASISADIAGVESGISWNSAWDAEVESEANDALVAIHLDHLLAADYDPASKPGVSTALLNELVENDAGVSRFTANALEQGPAGGGGSTNVTQIEGSDATDVIDARIAAAGLATASSLSTVGTNVTTVLTRIGTPTDLGGGATLAANAADIEGQTDDIGAAGAGLTAADDSVMTRLGTPSGANVSADVAAVSTAIAALNNLSAAQVRDAVSEDQGSVTRGCIEAVLLAYAAGDISTSGSTTTYKDPSNGETRIVGTVTSAGNRTATITCPTY